MNALRRKRIEALAAQVEDMKADLEALMEEEQDAYDNLPEAIQAGERGDRMQEVISNLSDAGADLDGVIAQLQEAAGN